MREDEENAISAEGSVIVCIDISRNCKASKLLLTMSIAVGGHLCHHAADRGARIIKSLLGPPNDKGSSMCHIFLRSDKCRAAEVLQFMPH